MIIKSRGEGRGGSRVLLWLWQLLAVAFAFGLQPSAFLPAQDFERIAPKVPEKREGKTEIPTVAKEAEGDEKILVEKLLAIVFVSSPESVKAEGVRGVTGIHVEGMELLKSEAFRKQMEPYLGQPVTMKRLDQLKKEVAQFCREHDRPLVYVSVPQQDITRGVVQVLAFEGRLGDVRVNGNRWFDAGLLKNQVSLKPGDTVSHSGLTDDLKWLNGNPFRQVNMVFAQGMERGTSDLVLQTKDRFPVRFYGGYENSGNDLTGDERLQMGFNWGNSLFLDHQMSYQFTADSDFEKMTAHSGSYVVPLPWRHRLTFFGSYAETKADIANPLFNLNGKSWQTSSRYTVPLPSLDGYSHDVGVGFDFKQSNNNLEFGGANVFNRTTDLVQWLGDYNGRFRDEWGSTGFGGSLMYGPGGWTERNKDLFFNAARAFAGAEYLYGKLSLDRVTRLPWDFTWTLKGAWQIADGNLLGSEQMGLGGYSTVRGYDEREANGDEGYLLNTEIRTPAVSLGRALGIQKAADQLQFLWFFDYGGVQNSRLLRGEDPHLQLAGIGPGVRYSITPWLSARFDYGFQLYDTGNNTRNNSRAHMGVVVSY